MKSKLLIREIKQKYKKYLNLLEKKIRSVFKEKVLVPEFITKGKRLRALAYIIPLKVHSLLNELTLNIAISIELLHASSLVHDDIIDDDEFRRENITLNKFYGNAIAVLSGDYLFIKSLEFVRSVGNFLILDEFISTSKKMIKGEFLEEFLPIKEKLNENVYLDIIYNKTGSLFEYALSCSEILISGKTDKLKLAGKFLGIAYQIIDDCEDLTIDLKKGKITLPVIYAHSFQNDILERLTDENYIKEILKQSKAIKKSMEVALNYLSSFENTLDREIRIEFESYLNYLKLRALECNNKFS